MLHPKITHDWLFRYHPHSSSLLHIRDAAREDAYDSFNSQIPAIVAYRITTREPEMPANTILRPHANGTVKVSARRKCFSLVSFPAVANMQPRPHIETLDAGHSNAFILPSKLMSSTSSVNKGIPIAWQLTLHGPRNFRLLT